MHTVVLFPNKKRPIRLRGNIRELVRRGTDNRLKIHLAEQPHAFNNSITVHFIKRLIKYHKPHGIACWA